MANIDNKVIFGESVGDGFGHAISLSSDGKIVAISAPYNEGNLTEFQTPLGVINNDTYFAYRSYGENLITSWRPTSSDIDLDPYFRRKGLDIGSVKVYEKKGSDWIQIGSEIVGEHPFDQIGMSITLSADGQTLAIGNPYSIPTYDYPYGDSSRDYISKPYVSVYKLINGDWSQIGDKIYSLNSNGTINLNDNFGYSTSLSADGKTLAVGAFYGEVSGASDSAYEGSNAGYVKIYQNNDGNFTQIGDTLRGDSLNGDEFGYSIDLSSDGSIVAVSSAQGGDIFVYKRTGDNWSQLGNTIEFNDYESDIAPVSRINKQERVTQVKLTNDGNYIAIGSPNSDLGSINTGKLKVFQNVDSSWVQVGSDIKGEPLSYLGTYIDIEEDNNGFLTLAASGTKGSTDSYVNVYKLINSEWLSFGLIDSSDNQSFPTNSLDLSDDASAIAIGTSHSPVNSSDNDENYISAGFIGYKEQTGNVRIQELSEGLVNSPTLLAVSSTNDSKPTITGNSEPGNEVYLYNETILLGTSITNEEGVFSITLSELSEGTYSLKALAKNSSGNVSSLSSPLSINIDSVLKRAIRGNSIYAIVDGPTWTESERNSNKLGGHLVTINDQEENDFIEQISFNNSSQS